MKRILLFLATNIAILVVISIVFTLLDLEPYLHETGLDYPSLLLYSAVIGFSGSIISLFLSKFVAKQAFSIKIINHPADNAEIWLLHTVGELSKKVGVAMPEVGVYSSSEPNAFATGWNRNSALVAVSSALLVTMDSDELEGVLAHELSHVANGDMVTLTLIQGVVNTFVVFFSRIAAVLMMQFFRRDQNGEARASNAIYYITSIVFQILFGVLASLIVMWFSRHREFRADAGSAHYAGREKMIRALKRLKELSNAPPDPRAPEFSPMKITDKPSVVAAWFSSHPPLQTRIDVLEKMN